jgi:hypothetical protein
MIWWPCHFWPRSKRMQTSLGAPAHPTSPSCPSPIDLDRVFRPFSPVVTHLKTTASSLPSATCAANIACHRCLLQPSKPLDTALAPLFHSLPLTRHGHPQWAASMPARPRPCRPHHPTILVSLVSLRGQGQHSSTSQTLSSPVPAAPRTPPSTPCRVDPSNAWQAFPLPSRLPSMPRCRPTHTCVQAVALPL